MKKQRLLKIDKKYQVLTDKNNNDLVYAISREEIIKLDKLRHQFNTTTLDKIPEEYTIEAFRIVEMIGENGERYWGIKDFNFKYKLQINQLLYPSIYGYN